MLTFIFSTAKVAKLNSKLSGARIARRHLLYAADFSDNRIRQIQLP